MNTLEQGPNFHSLSIRDLLEARDLYHYHLLSKENVVGTGIGLYLIRHKDVDKDAPRTLENSGVQEISWPCLLVFVRRWLNPREFGEGGPAKSTDMVPKTLYLPDGKSVPVCTVLVSEADGEGKDFAPLPASGLGGGIPIFVHVQGTDRTASTGCLVSDGHLTYALTARHACGPAGTAVFGKLKGGTQEVGKSASRQLSRMPFSEVYPDFPGRRAYLALDVGLVEVNDVTEWTSNVYGLPPAGEMVDLYEQNLTLQLVDRPVVAYGGVSGLLRGTVKALFYRYRSVGGYEYVGDFLIAPVPESRSPEHGDSGTIWHLDVTKHASGNPSDTPVKDLDLRPLAVLWGGQTFDVSGKNSNFSVATSLSNVCKLLDVEVVNTRNCGVSGYWGRMGHYSIAAYATDLVKDATLKALLKANLDSISFDLDTLLSTSSKALLQGVDFVPLADVADEVWKKYKTNPGGRDTSSVQGRSSGPEHPQHYADIDFPYQDGKTLRELCLQSPDTYLTPTEFVTYYGWLSKNQPALGGAKTSPLKQGLLPFRIWQMFKAATKFAGNSSNGAGTADFVATLGLVAHYIGDACQPLHGSVYADGDPSRMSQFTHPQTGVVADVAYAKGVHSAYETAMVDRHKDGLLPLITEMVQRLETHQLSLYDSGKDAALSAIELMDKTAAAIPAMELCDAYVEAGGGASATVGVQNELWQKFGPRTAQVMTLGAQHLACFWDSAWAAGRGAAAGHDLGAVPRDLLKARYTNTKFLESLTLDKVGSVL